MSSCLIVKTEKEIIIAVDSARSMINITSGIACREKNQNEHKLKKIGKDAVFVSGIEYATNDIDESIYNYLDENEHIKVNELADYLRKKYPLDNSKIKTNKYFEYGIDIFQFKDDKSQLYEISQCNENEIFCANQNKNGSIQLYAAGFKSEILHNELRSSFLKSGHCVLHDIFQRNYSEEIGGTIFVYKFTEKGLELLYSKELEEHNLMYVNNNGMCYYRCDISGSRISGSEIVGSTIHSSQYKFDEKGYRENYTHIEGGNVDVRGVGNYFRNSGVFTSTDSEYSGTYSASVTIKNGTILVNGLNSYLRGMDRYGNGYYKIIGISSENNIVIGHNPINKNGYYMSDDENATGKLESLPVRIYSNDVRIGTGYTSDDHVIFSRVLTERTLKNNSTITSLESRISALESKINSLE